MMYCLDMCPLDVVILLSCHVGFAFVSEFLSIEFCCDILLFQTRSVYNACMIEVHRNGEVLGFGNSLRAYME